jgi:hypothetical protein
MARRDDQQWLTAEVGRLERELGDAPSQADLDRVEARTSDHEYRLDTLDGDIATLRDAVAEADHTARSHLADLDRRLDEVEDSAVDGTRRIDDLQRRTRWLEHHLRAADGVPTADLTADPDVVGLAHAERRARERRAAHLPDATRRRHHAAVAAHAGWVRRRDEVRRAALTASREIAGDGADGPHRADLAQRYREARSALDGLAEQAGSVRRHADTARAALERDDAVRTTDAGTVASGTDAGRVLSIRLRTRLTEMVGRHELPPVWFATVLGLGPPADSAPWFDAAVAVLRYRAAYDIDDAVQALGPEPTGDAEQSARRRQAWDLTAPFRVR